LVAAICAISSKMETVTKLGVNDFHKYTYARMPDTKLEAKQTQATIKVAAQAKPENADFAKLVAWVSNSTMQPGVEDFDMLWLLFSSVPAQVGGIVLLLARRWRLMPKFIDITGTRFGRLRAVRMVQKASRNSYRNQRWLYVCDCGNENRSRTLCQRKVFP
jgi:hypothetical protein